MEQGVGGRVGQGVGGRVGQVGRIYLLPIYLLPVYPIPRYGAGWGRVVVSSWVSLPEMGVVVKWEIYTGWGRWLRGW